MIIACPDCNEIHFLHSLYGFRCEICGPVYQKQQDDAYHIKVMASPARDKNIPMLAWQSLDRQTKVGYSYWKNAICPGWMIDIIAPEKYFATPDDWKVYDSEEEAGQRVADLYEAFFAITGEKIKRSGEVARLRKKLPLLTWTLDVTEVSPIYSIQKRRKRDVPKKYSK